MNVERLGDQMRKSDRDDSPYENLIMKILFPDDPESIKNYVPCSPMKTPLVNSRPNMRSLGAYEKNVLGKMLDATLPVVCISGPMGSGKSTTIHFLYKYFLSNKTFSGVRFSRTNRMRANPSTILLAFLDFRDFVKNDGEEEDKNKLLEYIIDEMRARIKNLIDDDAEFRVFWNLLIRDYNQFDTDLGIVVAKIQSHLDIDKDSEQHFEYRKEIFTELSRDSEWYLRYLVLLWRYLSDERYEHQLIKHPSVKLHKSLIIFDNLDTLSPDLQRQVWDLVLRSARKRGPTFVMLMRPETFDRLGDADKLFDRVAHPGPTPFQIISNRLRIFKSDPEKYFKKSILDITEKARIQSFIKRHYEEMSKSTGYFATFVNAIAGSSIRTGLNIAQGIFLLRPVDMDNPELKIHSIIRECIRGGRPQFHWDQRAPIENPFFVYPSGSRAVLLKIRILKYLYNSSYDNNVHSSLSEAYSDAPGRAHARRLSELRNDFISLGYPEFAIRSALGQMMRKVSQLVVSNGRDLYDKTWGDEEELVYLTDIGKGYVTELIYNTDFVQEVMLDVIAQIPRLELPQSDRLVEKMGVLHSFLKYLLEVDKEEIAELKQKIGIDWYTSRFGTELISLDLIRKIKPAVRNILAASVEKYPRSAEFYKKLIEDFEDLELQAEAASTDIIGIRPHRS